MISNYKAVLFDWDGTLVDTCGIILDAHNHVRTYMGEPVWTMDDFWQNQASKSAREYYPEIYKERAEEAQTVLYAYVEEHHLTYLKSMPMGIELLECVAFQKVPMGVVSNKRHSVLKKEVTHMGWGGHFDVIVGAGEAARDKPAADPLLMAISDLNGGYKPADVLYVGDTETDLLCARNAGCPVVFIQPEKPCPDLIAKYNPDYVYSNLAGFLEAIKGQSPKADEKVNAIKAC